MPGRRRGGQQTHGDAKVFQDIWTDGVARGLKTLGVGAPGGVVELGSLGRRRPPSRFPGGSVLRACQGFIFSRSSMGITSCLSVAVAAV